MTQLTIENVKQKFEIWRQIPRRGYKTPKYLIDDVKELSKYHSPYNLFKEFKINRGNLLAKEIVKFQQKYLNSLDVDTLLSSRVNHFYPKKVKKEIQSQLKQGMRICDLSRKYNIPDSSISNWGKRNFELKNNSTPKTNNIPYEVTRKKLMSDPEVAKEYEALPEKIRKEYKDIQNDPLLNHKSKVFLKSFFENLDNYMLSSEIKNVSIPKPEDNIIELVKNVGGIYNNSKIWFPENTNMNDVKKFILKHNNVEYKDGVFHIIDKNMEPEVKTTKKKIKEEIPVTKIDKDIQKIENYMFITKFLSSLVISIGFYKLSYFEMLSIFFISYGFFSTMIYLLHFFYKNSKKDLSL